VHNGGSAGPSAKTVTVVAVPPWLALGVEAWDLPATRRDDVLVSVQPAFVRLAVLGGSGGGTTGAAGGAAGGPDGTPSPMGTDEPRYATGLVRAALREDTGAGAALEAANRLLFDASRTGHRAQASTAAVVATITRHGIEVLVAGGGAAYAHRDGDWFALAPGDPLTDEANTEWRGWAAEHPEATRADRAAARLRILDDPDRWRNPAIGAFERLRPDVATIEGDWDELVLATDGARLDPSLLGRLESWITGLRAWESQHEVALGRAGAEVHADVTVLRARRLPLPDEAAEARAEIGAGR